MKPTCLFPGCDRSTDDKGARGLCSRHYGRLRRHGTLDQFTRLTPDFETVEERFFAKVEPTGFCWLWTATPSPEGYGTFSVGGRLEKATVYAHRWAYEFLIGPIPHGLTLDHLCRVTLCVNPDHLEPVTHEENNRRKPVKDYCVRGHDLAQAYIRKDGARMCVKCLRITAASRRGTKS